MKKEDNSIKSSSVKNFVHLSKISDSNLVTDCLFKNIEIFERVMKSNLNLSEIQNMLRLLVHVYAADNESQKHKLLLISYSDMFTSQIQRFINNSNQSTKYNKKDFTCILMFIDVGVSTLPMTVEYYMKFSCLLEDILAEISTSTNGDFLMESWVKDLMVLVECKHSQALNKNTSYRDVHIFPYPIEFYENKLLSPNKLTCLYSSSEEYLETQFKLLREDYLNSVKEGINQYKRELRGAAKGPNTYITVYRGVTVDSIEIDDNPRRGIYHLIVLSRADENKLDNNLPDNRRKFMNGSLLFFSANPQFSSFTLAVVVDGNDTIINKVGEERRAICISVLGDPTTLAVGNKLIMLESTAFFEAYRQVLRAIQFIEPEKFSMKRYFIDFNFQPVLPSYLNNESIYTITNENVPLINIGKWSGSNLNLNPSQIIALKAALTRELTLIQGPPGSGKTHLLKTIINILVDNKSHRTAPLFLVCSRNRSLDNVLESLILTGFNVIRLGSQTKNDTVKQSTFSIKLSNVIEKQRGRKYLISKIKTLKKEILDKISSGERNLEKSMSVLEQALDKFRLLSEKEAADAILKSDIDVIGATTTGAARLHYMMALVKPEVVLIEEAAEVLEAHLVASIPQGSKHVILIGDHKQLQPQTAHNDSSVKYNMDVSLFERLIENGMDFYPLTEQYRMRPEISSLISPLFYKKLQNHPSVLRYPNVKGVTKNIFFIDHKHPEASERSLFSRWNKHEGNFLLALAFYFVQQGYSPEEITILTGYNAQVVYMNKILEGYPALDNIRISSIDDYQGEENLIILLSLVRSGSTTIGFLKKLNRVNVAFSRAKHGLYIVGNMNTLSSQSTMWHDIKNILEKLESIDCKLPLKCDTHGKIFYVQSRSDFPLNGGCESQCGMKLDCGHSCKRYCHPLIEEHNDYICQECCLRIPCGRHQCKLLCYEKCQECTETVEFQLECGHSFQSKCSNETIDMQCNEACQRFPCGRHQCKLMCQDPCEECKEIVTVNLPCGHKISKTCSDKEDQIACKNPCTRLCPNGHPCKRLCYEECEPCTIPLKVTISFFFCCKRTKPCHMVNPSAF